MPPIPAPEPLAEFRPGLWLKPSWLRFYGATIQTRMVVIQLSDGALLYSPTPAEPDAVLLDELRALGEPRWLVAPNEIHNVGLRGFQRAFPEAHTTGCLGHPGRVADVRFDCLLGAGSATADVPWRASGELEFHVIAGNAFLHEIVVFHRPTRTLIVTDAIEHFVVGRSILPLAAPVRWLFERMGIRFGQPCMSPEHNVCCDDPDALASSLETLLRWDFDAVVMSHGEILDGPDARRGVEQAFLQNIERARRRSPVTRRLWIRMTRWG